MADKAITDLNTIPGSVDDNNTWFAVAQSGTAYKVSGHEFTLALGTILDGHGGVKSIVYTPPTPPSLTGTMVVTLADNTTTTVNVENGKGISSIAKTSTAGLVDTYTITYNDSTTSSFTVSNGAKGETGDAWYVWIRYAGSMPTSDSDMGTTPDDWIGIYSGTEGDPSTLHYTDFDWFEYKGEKGDTGTASAITTQAVGYQASNSGTVVPSGSWTTTIPTVPPGSFLWTRTQLAFNDGSVVTAYSVSRFGIDGTGAVSTVNSISPDGNGNVALTADDIPLSNNISVEDTVEQIETDVGNVNNLTTLATNCVDAINELKTASNKALTGEPQTRIPSGSNLNSYTTAGTYYVLSDADASNISNMPQAASGTLFCVYRSSSYTYMMQIYVTTSSVQRVWTRLYNNGTWTQWLQNGGHIVVSGTATTSSGGTASLQGTYNTDEWGLVSISAAGAVSGYMLIPYKYGDAANGRWGFFACYSGSLNPIASTSISYRAVLLHL